MSKVQVMKASDGVGQVPHTPDGTVVSVDDGLQQSCFVELHLFFRISRSFVLQISVRSIVDERSFRFVFVVFDRDVR